MSNNLGYVLAVEKLLGIEVPERAQTIRVILAELTRLKSHLVWIATHALDIGAMTVFIYAFREREKVMDLYEKISGARMTASYFRVGGLSREVYEGFEKDVQEIVDTFPGHFDTYEGLLTKNTIWLQRTVGNGVISAEDAIDYGITGPALRGSGVDWDLRRDNPYSGYEKYKFEVPVGQNCDTFDRYKVRLVEMREAVKIVKQALDSLKPGPILLTHLRFATPPRKTFITLLRDSFITSKSPARGFPFLKVRYINRLKHQKVSLDTTLSVTVAQNLTE